jgi:predicted metalloendopeptidase
MFRPSRVNRISWSCLLLAAMALVFPGRSARAQTPTAAAVAAPEDGVDAGVKPGDDFFGYANGEWLRSTQIPPGKGRWGARNQIAELTAQQLAQVIREAPSSDAIASPGRKVAAFHAAYLDEARIEKKGLAPIAPLLKSVDRLRDKTALARWLGGQLRADVDPLGVGIFDSAHLFGLAVSFGIHGEPNHIAYLVQGGLGLTDRDAYLDDSATQQALRNEYRDHIARMLQRSGFEHQAASRANAVLALETAIARSHANAADSANERNADNRWRRRGDFAQHAPGLNWPAFFAASGLSREADIVAWQPEAIKGGAALVGSQPLSVWKDYLRFHLVHRYADVLPRSIAEPARAFRATAVQTPREQRAITVTNQAMPEAVGRLYVERHFPAATKARVKSILDNVVAAFSQRVAAVPWMTAATKSVALSKLQSMYFGVGYPETWQDDSALRIDADDALGNLQRVADWKVRNALAKLGRPVDRREWSIAPQSPGAILNFQLNSYNFAAALLQPPKFDPAASDAANYGAIGAIFAHEASHLVDTLGADYDAQGATRIWWTAGDKAMYATASQPLIDQFSAYRPFSDLSVDGKLTLIENIADLGGLAAAFDAYRQALGSRAADADELRRQDRQFFIGFARSWRAKVRDEAMRAEIKSDGHAPESYRIATVRNLAAWYDAFDVRPGQKLYLAPVARVRIW